MKTFREFVTEGRKADYYLKKDGFAKGKIIIVDTKTNTVINDQDADTMISKYFNTKKEAEQYWKNNPIGSGKKFESKGFVKLTEKELPKFYDGNIGITLVKQRDYLELNFKGKTCNNIVSTINEKDFALKEIKYNTGLSLKKLKDSAGLLNFLSKHTTAG